MNLIHGNTGTPGCLITVVKHKNMQVTRFIEFNLIGEIILQIQGLIRWILCFRYILWETFREDFVIWETDDWENVSPFLQAT